MTLSEFDAAAWIDLELAGADSKSGLRYVNLCTVDLTGHPQARLVVMRSANAKTRVIEIHTDVRTQKWREVAANPFVTILAFDTEGGLQLRLRGTVERHAQGNLIASDAWRRLSPWTRATYAGGPPGELPTDEKSLAAEPEAESGKSFFGVPLFRACELDWFQLKREGNRRALFSYRSDGKLLEAHEINP